MEANGYAHTIIENIKVPDYKFTAKKSGNYEKIQIGSSDKLVEGDHQYILKYRVLNAINFFKDHAEFYYNLIGTQWATTIDSADFTIQLYEALPDTPYYFATSGPYGANEKNTQTKWTGNKIFSGHLIKPLSAYVFADEPKLKIVAYEGLTVGISFPKDYLIKPNYTFRGIAWLLLPVLILTGMYLIWKKWGKDDKVTIQTEYYPPENISPSVSGYVIDGKLDQRDLTALIPYWGAGGFLKINESEKSSLLGILKTKIYEFVKLKALLHNGNSKDPVGNRNKP